MPKDSVDMMRVGGSDFGREHVDGALQQGLELKKWWDENKSGVSKFELSGRRSTLQGIGEKPVELPQDLADEPDYGFFAEADIEGRKVPIRGVVQDFFYDHLGIHHLPREAAVRAQSLQKRQLRTFVLKYFLRVTSWAPPQATPVLNRLRQPFYMRYLSMEPPTEVLRSGTGMVQHYYADQCGRIKACPRPKSRIYPLSEIGKGSGLPADADAEENVKQWVLTSTQPYDSKISLDLGGPEVVLPLSSKRHCVLSGDFIKTTSQHEFGPGWAFVDLPHGGAISDPGDRIEPGIALIRFRLKGDVIRVNAVFIVNRPREFLNISLNPMVWGRQMARFFGQDTADQMLRPFGLGERAPGPEVGFDPVSGASEFMKRMGDSGEPVARLRRRIEEDLLANLASATRRSILSTRNIWQEFPDWSDGSKLPRWVVNGEL